MKALYTIFLSLVITLQTFADIPIIAYAGVKAEESTIARFQEFREAGFDVSISNFHDLPTSVFLRALDNAQLCNVKLMALSGMLWEEPEKTIHAIKHHPALFGYFIYDEPMPYQVEDMKHRYQLMNKADSSKPFYLNLIPYYDDPLLQKFGIDHYNNYVKKVTDLGVPQICFDYYPITTSGIRPKWYLNLELIRKESIRTNRTFWAFALSTPHADYPKPTLAMLRLQMYTNLAYGAKGLLYFTYWTPNRSRDFYFHDGPIGIDGKRTKAYNIVRQMNAELRPMLPFFDKAQVTHVAHLGLIPEGAVRLAIPPLNITSLKIYGRRGALISLLKSEGHEYMAVVNKDYRKSLKLHIEGKSGVVRIDKKMQSHSLQNNYTISGGDILLFRLK